MQNFQVVDHEGNELEPGQEGNIGVKVKPIRPVGLFSQYVVSALLLDPCLCVMEETEIS